MDYLHLAQTIAKQAGATILKHRFDSFSIDTKGERSNYVTEIDKKIEKEMVKKIHSEYPDHTIIGEEFGESRSGSEYTWRLDPIDGTSNFVHRLPHSTVALSLEDQSGVLVGVVYDPVVDELFYAQKERGAFVNERELHVSPIDLLSKSCVIIDVDWWEESSRDWNIATASKLISEAENIRTYGSAAINMCYVACGRTEGFIGNYVDKNSMHAGKIILEEAGGMITDVVGNEWNLDAETSLVSNSKVHSALLAVCKQEG